MTALNAGCSQGDEKIVKILLEGGADVNVENEGKTALHTATIEKKEEIVRMLLERGANVNTKIKKQGITPLMLAVFTGNEEIVRGMLKKKPTMNLRNASGQTAFEIAIGKGNEKIKNIIKEEYSKRIEENTTTTEEI